MHDLNVYHTLQMSAHTGIPVDISGTRNCKRFLSNSRVGHFCNAIVPRRKKKNPEKYYSQGIIIYAVLISIMVSV